MKEDVILGTLLGDAWIQKRVRKNKTKSNGFEYTFAFEQSTREFAEWKAQLIGLPYSLTERDRIDKRTLRTYHSVYCYVHLNKNYKEAYFNLFYTPKKEVSTGLLSYLSDRSVAIWFLDDGNTYYNGNNCHLSLAVNGFSLESKDLIIQWFKERYDVNFKHSGKSIRLTSKEECLKFMDIVEDYIPTCMEYKKLSNAIEKYNNNLSNDRKKFRNNKYKT